MDRMKYFDVDPAVFPTNMAKFAIHRASEEGDLERVRQLIESGVSVDSRDNWRRTPLHWSAGSGQYKVVDFLSSLPECDLNLTDCYGQTPLLVAAMKEKKHVVHLLLQRGVSCAHDHCGKKEGILHYASKHGWADTVQRILDRGEVDINAVMWWGNTPLIGAAVEGHEDVLALLVRAGADVNRSNNLKLTALHHAASKDRTQVVRVLLETEGLELNPQDIYGDTPLHHACYKGHREVVKQLLKSGADITLKNNYGETALSVGIRFRVGMTAQTRTLEVIRLFVQHGGFLQDRDYVRISQNPVLKENILKDVGLCTQSIVNKFHRQSLPALSSISYLARKLPKVDKFKLKARQMDEVENLVRSEIERNKYCNVVEAHSVALSALCVLSLITCQSGGKRSASPDFGDSNLPFKKLHNEVS